jgi:hypothetical protein
MKKIVLSAFIFAAIASCKPGKNKQEAKVCECLQIEYHNLSVDFFKEITAFENKLLSLGILKDTTSQAYLDLFNSFYEEGEAPKIHLDYEQFELNEKLIARPYYDCFFVPVDGKACFEGISPFKRRNDQLIAAKSEGINDEIEIVKKANAGITAADFNIPLFRTDLLFTMYTICLNAKNEEAGKIKVRYMNDSEIMIEGTKVAKDSVTSYLSAKYPQKDSTHILLKIKAGVSENSSKSLEEAIKSAGYAQITFKAIP